MTALSRYLFMGGVAVLLVPLILGGMALGVGWAEAFGERWALSAWCGVLLAGGWWLQAGQRRLLPVAQAAALRQATRWLSLGWITALTGVALSRVAGFGWIEQAARSSAAQWVLAPWAAGLIGWMGAGLLVAGWWWAARRLAADAARHHDVRLQHRRTLRGVMTVWAWFAGAAVCGAVVACGTLTLSAGDGLCWAAAASLLAHRLWQGPAVIDLLTRLPAPQEPQDLLMHSMASA